MKRKIIGLVAAVILCTGANFAQSPYIKQHMHEYKPAIKDWREKQRDAKKSCKKYGEHCEDVVRLEMTIEKAKLELGVRLAEFRRSRHTCR